MPFLLGTIVGAIIAILLFSRLFEWALFMRVLNDPVHGKLASVFCAWLLAVVVRTFTAYPGEAAFPIMVYTIVSIGFGVLAYNRGVALRAEMEEAADSYAEHEEIFK
jgi:hypothetical protein